jgi:HSP20 family protein
MDRRNPFEEFERMVEEMNRGIRAFEGGVGGVPVDVEDRGDAFVVSADLPGYEKSDVDIRLSGDSLTLSASREVETSEADAEFVRRERSSESVSRSVRLPGRVDETATEATYENGVLRVTLPKAEADDGDSIPIE